jgi:hypothetical protein
VEFAEQFADGQGSREDRLAAFAGAEDATAAVQAQGEAAYYAASAAEDLVFDDGIGLFDGSLHVDVAWEYSVGLFHPPHSRLVREIFGNPFRPVAFDPGWRTSDVMLLARGIYDERAFDRMPILADSLQEAGCDSDELLNHLRDPHAAHVRGCWALDLVLGK